MVRKHSLLFAALGCLLLAAGAQGNIIIYSDVTTFSGNFFPNGGATVIGGDDITKMAADDITVQAGYGGATVSSFTFSVGSSTAVSARPLIRIYAADGAGGSPGTFIAGFNFNAVSFTAGTVALFTFSSANLFTVPANGQFWVGTTFDDNSGATGATAAQLNGLGEGIFAPPTIGSSADLFFETSSAGDFSSSNPAGSDVFFGGSPTADFGFAFSIPSPEPGTGLLSLLVAIPAAAIFIRRRRATKS